MFFTPGLCRLDAIGIERAESAWSADVGTVRESSFFFIFGHGGTTTHELSSYSLGDDNNAFTEGGVAPVGVSQPPAVPLSVRRVGPGKARIWWDDCSLDPSLSFRVERRCGDETVFAGLLTADGRTMTAIDSTLPNTNCEYQLVKSVAGSGPTATDTFPIGDEASLPTPIVSTLLLYGGGLSVRTQSEALGDLVRVEWYDTAWHEVPGTLYVQSGVKAWGILYFHSDGTVTTDERTSTVPWPSGTYKVRLIAHSQTTQSVPGTAKTITVP